MKQKIISGLIIGTILLLALGAKNWRKRVSEQSP